MLFSYKTAMSEVNVKTSRMGSKKWIYHEERNFASNYFSFLKILFQFINLLQRVDLIYQLPKSPYSHFSQTLKSFIWECFFPVNTHKIISNIVWNFILNTMPFLDFNSLNQNGLLILMYFTNLRLIDTFRYKEKIKSTIRIVLWVPLRDRLLISLLILSEFRRIN